MPPVFMVPESSFRHLNLFWASSVQLMTSHSVPAKQILVLYSLLRLCLTVDFHMKVFRKTQMCVNLPFPQCLFNTRKTTCLKILQNELIFFFVFALIPNYFSAFCSLTYSAFIIPYRENNNTLAILWHTVNVYFNTVRK